MKRKFDVAIVGAGLAGQSCALVTARGLLDVAIFGANNSQNNNFETHNFITNDGLTKKSILSKGLSDLKKYSNINIYSDPVIKVSVTMNGYLIFTEEGVAIEAEKVVFAMGNNFDFDSTKIEGLKKVWGTSAFSCAYCHAYELKGKPISIIAQTESDIHFIKLLRRWSTDIKIFIHAEEHINIEQMIYRNIPEPKIYNKKIKSIESCEGQITSLVLEDGKRVASDALFISDIDTRTNIIIDSIYNSTTFNSQLNRNLYKTDPYGRTDMKNIFIIGDSRTRFSTLVGVVFRNLCHFSNIKKIGMTHDSIFRLQQSISRTSIR
ncbi:NAD(P)/FAD-dependent oxidoreductase [Thalassotalea euphylliae]|uniref:NAD(P)/FAD-dependent oxidoreductase n=1 Tax=Thalassotalea euphylliae TaxID=1655234 RepID=A0A3E0TMI7_9GAMM|nr:NAD(P)/FAD-dependent oxidoreductase [Thalassotalea euphylliae]REL25698.1 NAD(P)/FAD-dependent oxidoreductase [Thalassotalea euphylliae]